MSLTIKQLKGILNSVEYGNSSTNILDGIKDELYKQYKSEYKEWEKNNFDMDYLFDFNDGPRSKANLLHIAAACGCLKIVKYCIEKKGANINEKDGDEWTPLHFAAYEGHTEVVKALIAKEGIDVNAESGMFKWTPLHFAAYEGHTEVVNALIAESKIDINKADELGNTPLCLAAKEGHTEVVKALIAKEGIDVNAESGMFKWTPLHFAAYEGHTEVVNALIADNRVNIGRYDVNIFLLPAAQNDQLNVARVALDKGADVNKQDYNGNTALHLAAENGHLNMVKYLLNKGADTLLKNNNGKTPRDLAKGKNIIKLLKKAETKQVTNKAMRTGIAVGAITALAVGIGCGVVGVGLSILAIASIVVAAGLIVGGIAGGIQYTVSKPSDKIDEPNSQKVAEPIVPSV